MRAFIIRRVELIAHGLGDVVVVGSNHCSGTLRVKAFLTRNGHPHAFIDLDRDADVQGLLDRFHVTASDVPVVICRGEVVLRNPTIRQIADCLGFNKRYRPHPDTRHSHCRRRTGRPCGRCLRCIGGPRRSGDGDKRPRRTGGLQLEDSRITLVFPRASPVKISRGGRIRRRRNSVRT